MEISGVEIPLPQSTIFDGPRVDQGLQGPGANTKTRESPPNVSCPGPQEVARGTPRASGSVTADTPSSRVDSMREATPAGHGGTRMRTPNLWIHPCRILKGS